MRKEIIRAVWRALRPYGLGHAGADLRIQFPRRIRGHKALHFGDRVSIGSYCWLEGVQEYAGRQFTPSIEVGDDVAIGRFATITAVERVRIGRGCLFSEYTYISDHFHDVFSRASLPLAARPLLPKGPVEIGPYCFLGFRAIVLPGVTLGEGCVVGANSVVTKSFEPYSIVAGVPARLLRKIQHD